MKKEYFDLDIRLLLLLREDIVIASVPNEDTNVTDDPYTGDGWWN